MNRLAAARASRLRATARCLLFALVLLGVGARGAGAVGVNDLNVFLFPEPGNTDGFVNAGPDSDIQIGASTDFLCVGGPDVEFEAEGVCAGLTDFELLLPGRIEEIRQNPLPGRNPSAADPLIFDASYTVTNNGPTDFPEGLVVIFTNVSAGYPDVISVGIDKGSDGSLFDMVALEGTFFYGGFEVGPLAVGETSEAFRVRYVLFGGALPQDANGDFVLPPLSASGFAVPEPGTALLLGVGLAALGWRSRRPA